MKTSASLRALLLFINALLWHTPVIHAATADSVNVTWDTRDAITSATADSVNVTCTQNVSDPFPRTRPGRSTTTSRSFQMISRSFTHNLLSALAPAGGGGLRTQ